MNTVAVPDLAHCTKCHTLTALRTVEKGEVFRVFPTINVDSCASCEPEKDSDSEEEERFAHHAMSRAMANHAHERSSDLLRAEIADPPANQPPPEENELRQVGTHGRRNPLLHGEISPELTLNRSCAARHPGTEFSVRGVYLSCSRNHCPSACAAVAPQFRGQAWLRRIAS